MKTKHIIKSELQKMKCVMSVLMLAILIFSCNSNDDEYVNVKESELSLNLQYPNGALIASSIEDLKKTLSPFVASKFGTDLDFTITEIEMNELPNRYVADVRYETSAGHQSNLLIEYKASLKTRTEPGGGGTTAYDCEKTENSKCDKGCGARVNVNENYCACGTNVFEKDSVNCKEKTTTSTSS